MLYIFFLRLKLQTGRWEIQSIYATTITRQTNSHSTPNSGTYAYSPILWLADYNTFLFSSSRNHDYKIYSGSTPTGQFVIFPDIERSGYAKRR